MRRWASKKDLVHDELVMWFERLGWQVIDTHNIGLGFPDVLGVHPDGAVVLVEFKTRNGRLTKAERRFHIGYQGPIEIVRTPADVMRIDREYRV